MDQLLQHLDHRSALEDPPVLWFPRPDNKRSNKVCFCPAGFHIVENIVIPSQSGGGGQTMQKMPITEAMTIAAVPVVVASGPQECVGGTCPLAFL
jgi:hypothetical protein